MTLEPDAHASTAGQPVNFTGEMVFPWFFEDFACLRPYKVRPPKGLSRLV